VAGICVHCAAAVSYLMLVMGVISHWLGVMRQVSTMSGSSMLHVVWRTVSLSA
jgi:TRAP-type mannitol/chloroaromatic compound transport system permease small subunit